MRHAQSVANDHGTAGLRALGSLPASPVMLVLPQPGGCVFTLQHPSDGPQPLLEVCRHADVMPQLLQRPPPARRHAPLVRQAWTRALHSSSSVLTNKRDCA